jgi:hypothetical protein
MAHGVRALPLLRRIFWVDQVHLPFLVTFALAVKSTITCEGRSERSNFGHLFLSFSYSSSPFLHCYSTATIAVIVV